MNEQVILELEIEGMESQMKEWTTISDPVNSEILFTSLPARMEEI